MPTKRSAELGVEPAAELERVLERLVAIVEPGVDRLAQHLRELGSVLVAEVAPGDVDPERQRQTGLEQPPLAEVDDLLQPVGLVRELALVDQEPGVGAARLRPRP